MIKNAIILLLFAALPVFPTFGAEDVHFVHYNKTRDDLAYDGIRVTIQDSRGFVWIGTHRGLSRWDGIRFKNYYRQDFGIESDYVVSMTEDSHGNLWIGTDKGIVIYDYFSDRFSPAGDLVENGKIDDRVFSLAEDSQGNMWAGSRSNGLFKLNLDIGVCENIPVFDDKNNPLTNIYRIIFGDDDKLWLAAYCDDIYVLERYAQKFSRVHPDFFHGDDVEGIVLAEDNATLYVAGKNRGLCRAGVDGKVTTLLSLSQGQRPIGLSTDGSGRLFLSSTEGLYIYDTKSDSHILLQNDKQNRFSLSDNYVTSALRDAQGGLWVGTFNEGMNHYAPYQDIFSKYYRTVEGESIEGCIVRGFAEDKRGDVFIATEQAGLLKLSEEVLASCPNIPKTITAACADGDRLWLGTQNGIYGMSLVGGETTPYLHRSEDSSDNRVITILNPSDSSGIYVATATEVVKYVRGTDSFAPLAGLEGLTIESMVESPNGEIWMASYSSGVFVYDPVSGTLKNYCSRNGDCAVPEMISSVCLDGNGSVWVIGFSNGIFRYDAQTDSFISFNHQRFPLLPTDVYFSATPDGFGNLYLSSDSGLVKLNPETGLIKVFSEKDGLLNKAFKKSVLAHSDGRLFFGSEDGFICFNPSSLETSPCQGVSVAITDFLVGGSPKTLVSNINEMEELHLSPWENSFGFDFATLGIPASLCGRIFYKLDGMVDEWETLPSTREVIFNNVPAGKYRLSIVSDCENPSPCHKDLVIIVAPKFYKSAGGICLMVFVLLTAIGLCIYTLRHRAFEKKQINALRKAAAALKSETPAELHFANADEEFIRKLDAAIMENLQNADFSNKEMGEILFLSPSSLNRKVRTLLGMTPNEYLRTKRLAVAANLLKTTNGRVNEICRAVGFPTPSYFTKCFKEKYGMLPIEYRAQFSHINTSE